MKGKTMAVKKKRITKNISVNKEMEVEDLLSEMQARFDSIEGKLDMLISKSSTLSRIISTEKDPGFKTHATVTKKFPMPQDKTPRERKMYRAQCAECNASCEVPFQPKADRPVYCKTCYSNKRNESSKRPLPNKEEIVSEIAKTLKIDISEPVKAKKTKPKAVKTTKTSRTAKVKTQAPKKKAAQKKTSAAKKATTKPRSKRK